MGISSELQRKHAARRKQRMVKARRKGKHTPEQWLAILAEFAEHCVCCWKHEPHPEKDHIVPVFVGGSDSNSNLQPACCACNVSGLSNTRNWAKYRRREWLRKPERFTRYNERARVVHSSRSKRLRRGWLFAQKLLIARGVTTHDSRELVGLWFSKTDLHKLGNLDTRRKLLRRKGMRILLEWRFGQYALTPPLSVA